jgi:hypothetical protein
MLSRRIVPRPPGVFDDPAVGLKAEPFVSGIPEMIDALVQDIPQADRGFRLLFWRSGNGVTSGSA